MRDGVLRCGRAVHSGIIHGGEGQGGESDHDGDPNIQL